MNPSDVAVLRAVGGSTGDLFVLDGGVTGVSNFSPFNEVSGALLSQGTQTAQSEALLDFPNDFSNIMAHTATLTAFQQNHALDMLNATFSSVQATLSNVTAVSRLPGQNPTNWTTNHNPQSATGIPTFDNLGWYPQTLVAADLDAPPNPVLVSRTGSPGLGITTFTVTEIAHGRQTGDFIVITGNPDFGAFNQVQITVIDADHYTFGVGPIPIGPVSGVESAFASVNGGAADLVIVHALRQIGSSLENGDNQGCITLRKYSPTTQSLAATFGLDPTDMGATPTMAAVADLESSSRPALLNSALVGKGGAQVGSPDILVCNNGDDSLTFYLQYEYAKPGSPPTYVSLNLPLSTVPLPPGAPKIPFKPGDGDAISVAIGDLNGDHANDFIVVGRKSQTVVVFLYDPDPTNPQSLLPLTNNLLPFRVSNVLTLPSAQAGRPAIANLTGTGVASIVVPSYRTNDLVTFIPRGPVGGTPTFAEIRIAADNGPNQVIAADVTGDGLPDLIVSNQLSNTVSVYDQISPGTLDRNFTPVATGLDPLFMAVGDLTGSGAPNLAVPNFGDSTVWIFARDPSLGLAPIRKYDLTQVAGFSPGNPITAQQPQSVAIGGVGDITGTPRNGLFVGLQYLTEASGPPIIGGEVIQGGLPPSVSGILTAPGSGARLVAVGDVNGDGLTDLLIGSQGSVTVFLLQPDGSYLYVQVPTDAAQIGPQGVTLASAIDVKVADVDGDGNPDMIVADGTFVTVFFGPWTGTGKTIPPPVMQQQQMRTANSGIQTPAGFDYVNVGQLHANSSGLLDIVATGGSDFNLAFVFYQTAPRVFFPVQVVSGHDPQEPVVGDLNGDGLPDLAFCWGTDNLVAVYYQQPNPANLQSALSGPVTLATDSFPQGIAIMDVTGAGKNDLVVAARGANTLDIFFQR
jgi:hypothetical protein